MKCVYSMSLFGTTPASNITPQFFRHYLCSNLRAMAALYERPIWELHIYYDETLFTGPYAPALFALAAKVPWLKLKFGGTPASVCEGMLWRMRPIWESDADFVFPRDVDALLIPKDKWCCEQFVKSPHSIMQISDNRSHNIGIMGGMGGFRTKWFRTKYPTWDSFKQTGGWEDAKGSDQHVLNRVVWSFFAQTDGMAFRFKGCPPHGEKETVTEAEMTYSGESTGMGWAVNYLIRFIGTSQYDVHLVNNFFAERFPQEIAPVLAAEDETDCHITGDFSWESQEPERRALLASDLNPMYSFFMPITTALWRYLGFTATHILVGSPEEWANRVELGWTRRLGGEVYFERPQTPNYTANRAQFARLFAYRRTYNCKPWGDGVYLLTSDADMLPLSKVFFHECTYYPERLFLYYGNAYTPAAQYPICYIGGTVATWRELLDGVDPNVLVEEAQKEPEPIKVWCYDETWLGKRIQRWKGFADRASILPRKGCPPHDRIDRCKWPEKIPGDMVDCHSVRPGHTAENWPKIEAVLNCYARDVVPLLNQYVAEWRAKHG